MFKKKESEVTNMGEIREENVNTEVEVVKKKSPLKVAAMIGGGIVAVGTTAFVLLKTLGGKRSENADASAEGFKPVDSSYDGPTED